MRNPRYSSALYHQVKREQRKKRLKAIAESISECIRIGRSFLGMNAKIEGFGAVFPALLTSLGIRRVNKLWPTLDLQHKREVTPAMT